MKAHGMTRLALDPAPELALEVVDHDRVVSHQVGLPLAVGCDLHRQRVELGLALGRHGQGRRPDLHPVQVLVQPVEEERQELLRVMLIRAILMVHAERAPSETIDGLRGSKRAREEEKRGRTKAGANLTMLLRNDCGRMKWYSCCQSAETRDE